MKKTTSSNLKQMLICSIFLASSPASDASIIFSTPSPPFNSDTNFGGDVTRAIQGGRFQNLANSMIDGAGAFLVGNFEMWDGGIEYYLLDTNSGGFPTDILASGTGQSAQLQDTGSVIISGLGDPLNVYQLTFELESTFNVPTNDAYVFGFRLTPEIVGNQAGIVALGFAGTENKNFDALAERFTLDGDLIWSSRDGVDQSLSFFFTGTIPEPSTALLLVSGSLFVLRRKRH